MEQVNYFTRQDVVIAWEGPGYYILELDQAGIPSRYVRARTLAQIEDCRNRAHPYGHYNLELDIMRCVDCSRAHGSLAANPATIRIPHEFKPDEYVYLCEEHAEKRGYIAVILERNRKNVTQEKESNEYTS